MTDFNSNLNNLFNNFQKQQQYNKKKFDVNGDGKINSKDATTLNTEKSKLLKEKNLFDVNGDGLFSQNDVDMFVKGDVDGNGNITQEELNFISKFKTNFKSALVKEKSSFEMDGIKYVQGKLASGVVDGKYYLSGKPATGTNKGVYYVKGEPAQGIVNGKTYNDGVQVKELDKVTNSMVSAQKALTTAQTNFDNVEKTLNKTKTELNKLKEARNNYESLVQKNPKNKTYKNNLASINSQINTKLNQIRNYEKQKASKQTALDNAQTKADTAQSNYINEQITLIEQGKVQKVYNADGTLYEGKIGNKVYQEGVVVSSISEGKQGSVSYALGLLEENINPENVKYDKEGRVISFNDSNASYTIEYNNWSDNVNKTTETRTTITKKSAVGANIQTERKEFFETGVLLNNTEIIRDKAGNKLQETYSNYNEQGVLKYFSESGKQADGTEWGQTKDYYDNGTLQKESFHDINGNRIKEYDEKGNLKSKYEANSDSTIKETTYNNDGSYEETVNNIDGTKNVSNFDSNNRLIKQNMYSPDGSMIEIRNTYQKNGFLSRTDTYKYDTNGNPQESLWKKNLYDGSYKERTKTYTENGNVTKDSVISYDKQGGLKYSIESSYGNGSIGDMGIFFDQFDYAAIYLDKYNNGIGETLNINIGDKVIINQDGIIEIEKSDGIKETYDIHGNIIKENQQPEVPNYTSETFYIGGVEHLDEKTFSPSGAMLTWSDTRLDDSSKSINYYHYGDNNNLQNYENFVYDKDGNLIQKIKFEYDINGNVISEIGYDENGNEIKRYYGE